MGVRRDADQMPQAERPVPLARAAMTSCHSWDGWSGQRHHTLSSLSAVTASGDRPRFFSGCHSLASPGWVTDKGALGTANRAASRIRLPHTPTPFYQRRGASQSAEVERCGALWVAGALPATPISCGARAKEARERAEIADI